MRIDRNIDGIRAFCDRIWLQLASGSDGEGMIDYALNNWKKVIGYENLEEFYDERGIAEMDSKRKLKIADEVVRKINSSYYRNPQGKLCHSV